jgi:sugar phosphate isomerase/epimerase
VRLSLSEISTVGASFAEDVAAYAAAGFDAIGIWEMKLPEDDEANVELLQRHGLAVSNCVPAVPSILPLGIPGMEGPPDPAERVESLCSSVRRLARYAPECVLCLTGPSGPRTEAEARALVAAGLRRVTAAAGDAGVRLGLEPIHPRDRETTSFVSSIAAAVELLDDAGLQETGIMADTYNLWDDRDACAWLERHAARVTGLHVAGPPGSAPGRTLPGEERGQRASELVSALRSGGWDGSLDVEIFSTPDGFWSLPVEEAARRAFAAAQGLLEAA